jgi:2-amino-4-hydroxy-6-hydroxymethyldihydropteridine diphosphokinase
MQKRVRTIIDGPRTIDIDILLYNQEIIKTDDLVVPHPRMHERSFVMFPLKEITTTINIPGIKNINIMVDKLDKNIIKKINE